MPLRIFVAILLLEDARVHGNPRKLRQLKEFHFIRCQDILAANLEPQNLALFSSMHWSPRCRSPSSVVKSAIIIIIVMKNFNRRSSHGHHGSKRHELAQHAHARGLHAFTHLQLHQHSYNHVVRSATSVITEFGIFFLNVDST